MLSTFSDLWLKRQLILNLAIFNVKNRYLGTYLGSIWAFLEPLLLFVLLYFVFTEIRTSSRESFAIYLLTGIMLYHIFVRGTTFGLNSIRGNKSIILSINIKREFLPLASTLSTTAIAIVNVIVFLAISAFFQFEFSLTIFALPIILCYLLLLILGISYILSIVNVFVKDIQRAWPIGIHALFFISPIFWYLDSVGGVLQNFQKINPLGQIVELAHHVIVYKEFPPLNDWLYTLTFILVILGVGLLVFRIFDKRIIEEL